MRHLQLDLRISLQVLCVYGVSDSLPALCPPTSWAISSRKKVIAYWQSAIFLWRSCLPLLITRVTTTLVLGKEIWLSSWNSHFFCNCPYIQIKWHFKQGLWKVKEYWEEVSFVLLSKCFHVWRPTHFLYLGVCCPSIGLKIQNFSPV